MHTLRNGNSLMVITDTIVPNECETMKKGNSGYSSCEFLQSVTKSSIKNL